MHGREIAKLKGPRVARPAHDSIDTAAVACLCAQRVRALVLCDTGPGYKKDEARESWNRYAESFARKYEENGLAALG